MMMMMMNIVGATTYRSDSFVDNVGKCEQRVIQHFADYSGV